MTQSIDASTGPVLELGPGTGVFTDALLERGVQQQCLTLVELGEDFVRLLRLRFPHARIVKCDAARMREAGMDTDLRYGAVISGLPLLAMQPPVVFRIVKEAVRRLEPGASFYQFTYGLRCAVPDAVMTRLGLKAQKVGTVMLNIPPASVYRVFQSVADRSTAR